ncbi:hypothetical protein E2C01_010285 [Portunus trituberculatus]|uniref:Uncharacterized protein n=1 Tax=Portunus trituberculatus TaxID=210409 RepID=A0A5B7D872_PORTR|nr:hypothetical protein [Portunus trituberculatus]
MSPFHTCYFRTFENFSALRTSAPCLVVSRYGGAEVRTKTNILLLVKTAVHSGLLVAVVVTVLMAVSYTDPYTPTQSHKH